MNILRGYKLVRLVCSSKKILFLYLSQKFICEEAPWSIIYWLSDRRNFVKDVLLKLLVT